MDPIANRVDLWPKDGIQNIREPGSQSGGSFSDELSKAIGSVEHLQLAADKEAEAVAQGAGNLHETALALEKADVAMRVAVKVRNKLVETYQEVMRMNV